MPHSPRDGRPHHDDEKDAPPAAWLATLAFHPLGGFEPAFGQNLFRNELDGEPDQDWHPRIEQ